MEHSDELPSDWAGFEAMDAVLNAARAFLETASAEDWRAAAVDVTSSSAVSWRLGSAYFG